MSRTYIKKAIRKKVLEQAQGMCEYCKSPRAYATELLLLITLYLYQKTVQIQLVI